MSNNYNFSSNCVEIVDHPNVKVEENGKKFIALNPNRKEVLRIKIDGCVINDNTTNKCDFLIIDTQKDNAYFIELKGKNVKHAIKQLTDTIEKINNTSNKYISEKFSGKFAFAVLSHCPLPSLEINLMQKEFSKKKIKLVIKNKEIHHSLD